VLPFVPSEETGIGVGAAADQTGMEMRMSLQFCTITYASVPLFALMHMIQVVYIYTTR